MEASSNFTVFTRHTIGGNSVLDTDMDLIEMFVRTVKEPDNVLAQSATFNYYISRAIAYWNKLVDFLEHGVHKERPKAGADDTCDKYLLSVLEERDNYRHVNYGKEKNPRFNGEERVEQEKYFIPDEYVTETERKLGVKIPGEYIEACRSRSTYKIIKDNMGKYELMFNEYIQMAQDNFRATNRYSYIDIKRIFELIANLFCLRIVLPLDFVPEDIDENNYISSRADVPRQTFLLTNTTGWFYLNTYLYAFFEDVILLGLPAGNSEFDGKVGCPLTFVNHDVGHTVIVKRKYYTQNENGATLNDLGLFLKDIYYTIIYADDLSKDEKEACIFVLWYIIHERQGLVITLDNIYNIPSLKRNFFRLAKNFYGIINQTKRPKIEDHYPASPSDIFKYPEDCIMFFYNYIITKYEVARDVSDYITKDEMEEYLLPKFMKGAKRGLEGYEQYKLI